MSEIVQGQELDAPEKILFIDDEKNVLLAIQRQLRRYYAIETATSYDEALSVAESRGPFAVVVCDMRMPGRDGVETLAALEKVSPETIRVMLTGNADQETAAAAINQGHIFRFLTKPCSEETLRATLKDAIRQHQLETAEKTLLQQTLTGSVRLLVDVLSMIAPEAFGRASRARQWVMPIAKELGLSSRWDIELATMLAPIGYVAIPPEVAAKISRKATLSPEEREMLARVPDTGRRLLAHIPRLKNVAQWVGLRNKPPSEDVPMGARIVRILTDLAEVGEGDIPTSADLARLQPRKNEYDSKVFAAALHLWGGGLVSDLPESADQQRVKSSLVALLPNDLLLEPIVFKSGKLLLSAGSRISAIQLERLRNLRTLEPIVEPIEISRTTAAARH